ncbi:nitroreductase/quinone reductase family protein [Streptomyces sp. 150FB]|uniref:nitroreductase/quinone reductase family protein n=1 Tax=Streptomyces sp. 150FB TaxID=1576605 RepID=UPI0007C66EB4|nr:nitroreductase/quinone reductase family protein [Streptomyces sp. 150FB]
MSDMNAPVIAEFRANGGVVGGHFEGKHLLLLHTVGRRSGKEYINPMVYTTDSGSFLTSASNGGADKEPLLVSNLEAMSEVTIEVGERTLRAKPTVWREGPERDRLYAVMVDYWPDFREYETHTSRAFPVIQLDATEATATTRTGE